MPPTADRIFVSYSSADRAAADRRVMQDGQILVMQEYRHGETRVSDLR